MKIDTNDYRVRPGEKVNLKKWPTIGKPICDSKEDYKKLLQNHVEHLSRCSTFTTRPIAMLSCWSFKGWMRRARMARSGMSCPESIRKAARSPASNSPVPKSCEHDFLWRTTQRLPERGRIGIFNRSYYEEVLVVRVHPEILRNQGLPEELRDEKDALEAKVSLHRRSGETSSSQRHPDSQDLPAPLLTRSNESGSLHASTSQTRTGSSAPPTFTSGNIGRAM